VATFVFKEENAMTTAREKLISLEATSYYHIISRCVRRAFLCGHDRTTGQSFEHRKEWVIERMRELDKVFAIDYAIMSNHFHLVLRIDAEQAETWGDDELIRRWTVLFKRPVLIQRYQEGKCNSKAEKYAVNQLLKLWRTRLMDISWFMRCLNEYLARRANQEDQCTILGRTFQISGPAG